LGQVHAEVWYFLNLVWCDICNSILPRTQRKATEQALARKGDKFWGSKGSQQYSANLRGNKRSLKMKSSDTVRVWFVPVLARGKLHIEPLPENFPGETEEGAEILVARVRAALNVRFPDNAPKILFTDRGNSFFDAGSGAITGAYSAALRRHGLKAFMGSDASKQPGCLQEAMLHETAMAWMRVRLAKTTPNRCWEESTEAYIARLKEGCAHINSNHDVEALCRRLPNRVQRLMDRKGDRIPK
jgi:hypothetical protein